MCDPKSELPWPAIVLGAAVWPGGRPSPALRRRTLRGAELVQSGRASLLILTGGVGRVPPAEAIVMREIALEAGLDAARILIEDVSTSTVESAIRCAEILRARGLVGAWLVSDDFHLPRSLFLFRRLGLEVRGSAVQGGRSGSARRRRALAWLRELCVFPWSWLRISLAARAAGRRES